MGDEKTSDNIDGTGLHDMRIRPLQKWLSLSPPPPPLLLETLVGKRRLVNRPASELSGTALT